MALHSHSISAWQIAENPAIQEYTKHFDVDVHFVKGKIDQRYDRIDDQLTDFSQRLFQEESDEELILDSNFELAKAYMKQLVTLYMIRRPVRVLCKQEWMKNQGLNNSKY